MGILKFKHQDWILNGALVLLALLSLLILSSISQAPQSSASIFRLQFFWYLLSFFVIFFVSQIDLRPLVSYRWIVLSVYLFSLFLLFITLFFEEIRNTRGWIQLGPLQFQTAEFAKLALLLLLSYFLAKQHVKLARLSIILKSFIYFILPVSLVMLQPDAGSAVIFLGLWAGFLLVSGIRWRHLLLGLLILIFLSFLGWSFLAPYQQDRILGFLNPESDPLGVNYNVIQSKIAVGSAGFLGKGFRQGTQVQLRFLPEAATDFIFPAFIEEWGFVGGTFVVGLFVVLLFRIIRIGGRAHNNFFRFICIGAVIMLLVQLAINTGSALGFFPVVGVTFPFFSYGGSSLLTSALLLGIIQSIAVHSSRRF
ncbi:MAG: hypothetical protein COU08_01670 [Candidatus Harrisonbacteria bacterium CG10_big_fil_rev_8_21_14_0_10_42_17]|uniref:Rod shape-determining protein RodA n=1 Tax=Candidatus Harrisonbacteria bacterium CG10_big_fil_rev_8_21_14_0_10_42_17 TaxID=1974584 RepID=A0A2M6WIX5_9BACT|nr:MAG: hypothetical protein COU08_01670 [Candidatus Harrisonbacteria bacterium CG10_big_fil_rev_8_21_14_0_10_42_17]